MKSFDLRHDLRELIILNILVFGMICVPIVYSPSLLAQFDPEYAKTIEEKTSLTQYALGGADTCLACHRGEGLIGAENILQTIHSIGANPQSPFAQNNKHCQACHGPSLAHLDRDADGKRPPPTIVFDERVDAVERNKVCLACHQNNVGQQWHGSVHQFEQLACSSCHKMHATQDAVMNVNAQASVCFTCHKQQQVDLLRPTAHPVARGLLTCGDCHQPHGSSGVSMLKENTLNETCFECHAEKRGPLLWEHAPVREDCSNCHVPHGSNHNSLLVSRPPFLCQQCHLAQFHPSTAFGGNDVAPNGASRLLVNRNCMNCHSQVHGSNHPSGAGLIR